VTIVDLKPLVSIGMPVRNGENFLEEALKSLLSQTFEDFELIISDNASEDGTRPICEGYAATDRRIRYLRLKSNIGAARNWNHVFKLAHGKFFKWAPHDDIYHPSYLEACLEVFRSSGPSVVAVYPRSELIDDQSRFLKMDTVSLASNGSRADRRLAHLIGNIHLANPVLGVMRSDVLRLTRLIDSFIGSDLVLLSELLMMGEFREVPLVLFKRRMHGKRSLQAHKTQRDYLRWIDPSRPRMWEFLPVPTRLRLEYIRSVHRMPLKVPDKLRCYGVIARVGMFQELRNIGGAYKSLIRNWLLTGVAGEE
jgi:glycosyltransferase involved in cell wall biosynthesis